jgi:hypothetical protein
MEQTVITKDQTLKAIVASAEKTLGRKVEPMELALMEYTVEQIRLGVAEMDFGN